MVGHEDCIGADPSMRQRFLGLRRPESRRYPERLLDDSRGNAILALLEAAGWEAIALGDDAVVFADADRGQALRLAQNAGPYSQFVALAVEARSPHFPKFHHHEWDGQLALSWVEYLELLPISYPNWADIDHVAALAHRLADGRPGKGMETDTHALQVAAIALGCGARDGYYALDLGVDNILLRPGTGEIVFNDPWCPWGE
ncbi:hypothetical protein [Dongia sp.]|uniref:hypothetical protein n=1 Tax=Dongia sp. TaxID=1977262 RepID=UPI0035B4962E